VDAVSTFRGLTFECKVEVDGAMNGENDGEFAETGNRTIFWKTLKLEALFPALDGTKTVPDVIIGSLILLLLTIFAIFGAEDSEEVPGFEAMGTLLRIACTFAARSNFFEAVISGSSATSPSRIFFYVLKYKHDRRKLIKNRSISIR
jgi:hypothetical protein